MMKYMSRQKHRHGDTIKESVREKGRFSPELISVMTVLFFRFVFYGKAIMGEMVADSGSYVDLTWKGFLAGHRMPLFPAIIWLNKIFLRDNYLAGVAGCQAVVSLVAVVFFYKAVRIATENRNIACIAAVFWGCCPGIMCYDALILSESMAISISVFLLYFTVSYIKQRTLKSGIGMLLCALAAAFEKPALAVYVPAVFGLLVIQFICIREMRQTVIRLSAMVLGIFALLIVYAFQVYSIIGVFSISDLGPRHTLAACLETGLYKNYPDRELVDEIERVYMANNYDVGYVTTTPVRRMFGSNAKEINRGLTAFNRYCIKSDPVTYVTHLFARVINAGPEEYKNESAERTDRAVLNPFIALQKILWRGMRIGHVYLINAVAFLLTVKKWIRDKKCPWYYLGTTGIIAVILASVFVGTYNGYYRCTIYVLPFAYFGMALFLKELAAFVQQGEVRG